MQKLISAAAYARLRNLNKSTISRQIADGTIPLTNGKIDPVAADRARERNLNGIRREQVARVREKRAEQKPGPVAVPSAAERDAVHQAVVEALRQATAPDVQLSFARAARRVGCGTVQAFALALLLGCEVTGAVQELGVEDLLDFEEPTPDQWRAVLGEEFDFEAGDAQFDRAILGEVNAKGDNDAT